MDEQPTPLFLRISAETEKRLRKQTNKRGALSRIVCEAITLCDLNTIEATQRQFGGSAYKVIVPTVTQVVRSKVVSASESRGLSCSVLVEAALRAYFSRP